MSGSWQTLSGLVVVILVIIFFFNASPRMEFVALSVVLPGVVFLICVRMALTGWTTHVGLSLLGMFGTFLFGGYLWHVVPVLWQDWRSEVKQKD
jgi:hypothetical protein